MLNDNDTEKVAGSHYDCPSLFYEVAVEVHPDAKIREYLGFTMKERATRMEVVADDLWNDPTMWVLAVELELWYFLSCNEASELLVRRKDTVTGIYGDSISARDSGWWHKGGVSASLLVCVSGQDGSVAKTDDRVDRQSVAVQARGQLR